MSGLVARLRGQRGVVGGAAALAFGVLVFVVGTLLALNAWAVADAKFAVEAAAREATRAVVEAPGAQLADGTARGVARRVATRTLVAHGKAVGRLTAVELHAPSLTRCAPVRTTVRYTAASLRVPLVGAFAGPGIAVTGTHTEVVDPLRSGVPGGEAACGGG